MTACGRSQIWRGRHSGQVAARGIWTLVSAGAVGWRPAPACLARLRADARRGTMASFPYRPVAPATGLTDAFTERAAEPATAHSHQSTGPKERPRTGPCSSERTRPTRSVRSPTAVKSILMTHRMASRRAVIKSSSHRWQSRLPPGRYVARPYIYAVPRLARTLASADESAWVRSYFMLWPRCPFFARFSPQYFWNCFQVYHQFESGGCTSPASGRLQ